MTKIITDKKLMATKFINDKVFTGKVFNIVKNWKQNRSSRACIAGASAFGWFFVILSGAGWFWAISDYFMIYTIYMIYFFYLYSYHLKAFSSRWFS